MIRLNLPSCEIKIGGTREKPAVWDVLRRKYVALTPEEWVRQHFVNYLIHDKGYPQALMSNEVNLTCAGKRLRADTVVYDRDLRARVIVEYKAPSVELTQRVLDQIAVYRLLTGADVIIVSNGIRHFCCETNGNGGFTEDIPDWDSLAFNQ